MRVARYYTNRDIRIEELPRPEIGETELLLRVCASGICGSDLMEWYRRPKAPCVLGHEVAGEIVQAGTRVREFAVGDRVVATHHVPCGDCRYCRSDRESVCETLRSTNFDPGGFAEYLRLPEINVRRGTFRLPEGVGFEAGSFAEPLACVLRAQRLAGFRPGDAVAVLGSGVSGILQIQLARSGGALTIAASDTHASRLAAARRFGAHAALPADADLVARLRQANAGRLYDRVVVCTGARAALEQALELVDRGGTLLVFAPPAPQDSPAVDFNDLWRRNIQIVHSYAGPPDDMRGALQRIADGTVDVTSMVSHRLGLGQVQQGFRLMTEAADSLKIIVDPRRD